jgi:beta-alanine--pyruvate transaminase
MDTPLADRQPTDASAPNDLDALWMPFTANRQFKQAPRLLVSAQGMHYRSHDGREILDGTAGLWCVNAGHNDPRIAEAIAAQARTLDYAPGFQMGHLPAFRYAARLAGLLPGDIDHVFFTNSGSEAADTALKIALAYHRACGDAMRSRLIGRARGYHGVGFGGISVGGIANNRRAFGTGLPGVDHLPHTHSPEHNAFSRGQPAWGAHLADALEDLVALHGADTIAAVIVEPVAGSTGVLVPPVGYLERLRELCTRHGILLIFDEVITGFGRLGAPFAADHFGVQPDILVCAKGLTNGAVPMGAVGVRSDIYEAFMAGPEESIELFHGYTYSGHPLACAAADAALDVYLQDGLFARAAELAPYWEDAVQSLRGLPHVIDLRNLGLIAGIELEPIPGKPTRRAYEIFVDCYERGLLIRTTGDIIALSPPLILDKGHIDRMVGILGEVLREAG